MNCFNDPLQAPALGKKEIVMAIPQEVVIWQFEGQAGNVRSREVYTSSSGYNLFCTTSREYLSCGKQPFGSKIDWISNPNEEKFHFVAPGKRERPLLTGEPVAFGISGCEAFICYDERTFGINVSCAESPSFEWKICGVDGRRGAPIVTGQPYAIVNMNVRPSAEFFIYLDRVPAQANIGWTSSPNWPGRNLANVSQYKDCALAVAAP